MDAPADGIRAVRDFTWRHARRLSAQAGRDDTSEAEVARVLDELLTRAQAGPPSDKASARVAARTRVAAAAHRPPAIEEPREDQAAEEDEKEGQIAEVIPLASSTPAPRPQVAVITAALPAATAGDPEDDEIADDNPLTTKGMAEFVDTEPSPPSMLDDTALAGLGAATGLRMTRRGSTTTRACRW